MLYQLGRLSDRRSRTTISPVRSPPRRPSPSFGHNWSAGDKSPLRTVLVGSLSFRCLRGGSGVGRRPQGSRLWDDAPEACVGTVTSTSNPPPVRPVSSTVPPCSEATDRTIANPSPAPSLPLTRESTRGKGSSREGSASFSTGKIWLSRFENMCSCESAGSPQNMHSRAI